MFDAGSRSFYPRLPALAMMVSLLPLTRVMTAPRDSRRGAAACLPDGSSMNFFLALYEAGIMQFDYMRIIASVSQIATARWSSLGQQRGR